MLATKISFMNELANIAERVGADIEKVRLGIGSDPRIGYSFIYPGTGYGGSCFPKDVKALVRSARDVAYEPAVLQAVEEVNDRQKSVLVGKLRRVYAGKLAGKCFALWGLAFKPNTDDMREAASLVIIRTLLAEGANVRVYDPVAMTEAKAALGTPKGLHYCSAAYEAIESADALLIATEWQEFRSPDFERLKKLLKQPRIFDGRNLYDPALLARMGIEYYAIGRGMDAIVDWPK
jgi:UDPglucose 6-dehydrogenase